MTHARLRRYLRHGTLPQLAAFEAVARLGSCSRAAEELHLSQPTISVRIAKLTRTEDARRPELIPPLYDADVFNLDLRLEVESASIRVEGKVGWIAARQQYRKS